MADVARLRALVDSKHVTVASELGQRQPNWAPLRLTPEIDEVLPDGGLPRGAIIELSAPHRLGRTTSLALSACAQAQREGRMRRGESAWCAWIDPDQNLYAPAVQSRGVDLARLLVVRAPRAAAPRIALQMVQARILSVLIIDVSSLPGAMTASGLAPSSESLSGWVRAVRRLALAIEASPMIVILLTDTDAPRPLVLPVAMRIELERESGSMVSVRIAKEKHGRISGPQRIGWTRPPRFAEFQNSLGSSGSIVERFMPIGARGAS